MLSSLYKEVGASWEGSLVTLITKHDGDIFIYLFPIPQPNLPYRFLENSVFVISHIPKSNTSSNK